MTCMSDVRCASPWYAWIKSMLNSLDTQNIICSVFLNHIETIISWNVFFKCAGKPRKDDDHNAQYNIIFDICV